MHIFIHILSNRICFGRRAVLCVMHAIYTIYLLLYIYTYILHREYDRYWVRVLNFRFVVFHDYARGSRGKGPIRGGGSYRRVREKPHRPQARVDGSIRITVHEMVIVFPHMMFHNIIKGQNTIYAYYRYITEDTGILMGEVNSIMYSLYLNNILKIICKNVISLQYYN